MKDVTAKYKVKFPESTLYVGSEGMMRSGGTASDWQFIPYERGKEIPKPPKVLPRAHGGPIGDLLHVMKNGGTPCSDFPTSAGPLASFALSRHIAMLVGVGKKVEWDVEKMTLYEPARGQPIRPSRVPRRLGTLDREEFIMRLLLCLSLSCVFAHGARAVPGA